MKDVPEIAREIVQHWENMFGEDDKGGTDEVRLARAYLVLLDRQSKSHEYAANLQRFLFALAKGNPVPEVGLDLHARKLALEAQEKIRTQG